eukprot:255027-Chlamydomonas_euryale.AAC.5
MGGAQAAGGPDGDPGLPGAGHRGIARVDVAGAALMENQGCLEPVVAASLAWTSLASMSLARCDGEGLVWPTLPAFQSFAQAT